MAKKPKRSRRELTPKQLKFIALYKGNGFEAAKLAGYNGDDHTLRSIAYENLTKPDIRAAIKRRFKEELEPLIATRMDRQKFWSKVMKSSQTAMRDRLKAAELLGKSEADFTDVVKNTGEQKVTVVTVTQEQLDATIKKFNNDC